MLFWDSLLFYTIILNLEGYACSIPVMLAKFQHGFIIFFIQPFHVNTFSRCAIIR